MKERRYIDYAKSAGSKNLRGVPRKENRAD